MITINPLGFAALTEAVNQMIPVPSFIKNLLFKREDTFSTKEVMVDVVVGGQKILPLVNRGNPGKLMSNTTQKSNLVQPPQLKPKKLLTADDLYYTRGAGAPIFVVGGGAGDPVLNARKERYAVEQKDMLDAINRTIEFLCCKGLTGSYSISQDDGTFTIDFGMPAGNKPTLSGNALWSAPTTCTPIKNLRAWKIVAQKASGKIPTVVVMTPDTWEQFLAADEVVKYFDKLKIDLGQIKTEPSILSTGAEKKATVENLDIYTYAGVYTDANGAQQQLIADGYVSMLSPNADHRLLYGGIDDLEAGTVKAKYFSKDWIEKDPSGLWLLVQSNPLPTFCEPAANVYAKVIA